MRSQSALSMTDRFNSSIISSNLRSAAHPNRLGVRCLTVLWPGVVSSATPEFAVVLGATGIMPTDEQAVAEHVVDEKSIDHRRVALEILYRTVKTYVENHPDLQLGGYDRRCFEGLHEGRRVANAGHRAIVHLTVDKIGKRNDGALLEFRYAIGFKERVEVRFDFGKAGYIAVEDVPVGCVYRKWNNEYPTVRTRATARVYVCCRTGPSSSSSIIAGQRRMTAVLVGMKDMLMCWSG